MHAPALERGSIAATFRGLALPPPRGVPAPRLLERGCPPRLSCPERLPRVIAFASHIRFEIFVPPPHNARANATRSPDCSSSSASTERRRQARAARYRWPRGLHALPPPDSRSLARTGHSRS